MLKWAPRMVSLLHLCHVRNYSLERERAWTEWPWGHWLGLWCWHIGQPRSFVRLMRLMRSSQGLLTQWCWDKHIWIEHRITYKQKPYNNANTICLYVHAYFFRPSFSLGVLSLSMRLICYKFTIKDEEHTLCKKKI